MRILFIETSFIYVLTMFPFVACNIDAPSYLSIVSASDIARADFSEAHIQVSDLPQDQTPTVKLVDSKKREFPLQITKSESNQIRVLVPNSKLLQNGPATIFVQAGEQSAQALIRIYTPPVMKAPLTTSLLDTPHDEQLERRSVVIRPSQDNPLQNILYGDCSVFELKDKKLEIGSSKSSEQIQCAPWYSQTAFTKSGALQLDRYIVLNKPGFFYLDRNFDEQLIRTMLSFSEEIHQLSADPNGHLAMITGATQMQAFFAFEGAKPLLVSVDKDVMEQAKDPSLLKVASFNVEKNVFWDALLLTQNKQPFFLTLSEGKLGFQKELSQKLQEQLSPLLQNVFIDGWTIFDLDQDQLPDVVMALRDQKGEKIVWIPYLGKGKFGAPLSVDDIPTNIGKIDDLAVGDVDSDGNPDLAVVTRKNMFLFLNQSM